MTQSIESQTDRKEARAGQPGNELFWACWTVAAAFGCYFCTYAFRKPFTAASYADTELGALGFKTVLVTSQVAGYMVSKFLGIKLIAEMPPARRAISILWLIIAAEVALILFGLVPRPWNAICMFANGLPLGMVFGLVLGMLEGRRLTEALTAGLCASFILSDGVTKSAGAGLLSWNVPEDWMPAAAGGIFFVPLAICVAMLTRVPPPTEQDIAARTARATMNRSQRWNLVWRHAAGLIPLTVMYLMVTIVRSIRADYAPEIWKGLGSPAVPATFTQSEFWVMLGVILINGGAVLIVDNRKAFFAALATCGLGFGLLTFALLAHRHNNIDDFTFMVLIGLGLYLPYVAVHTTVFERMLAMTGDRGNIGFLMYVVDSIGYLGYVCVMLAHNFGSRTANVVELLSASCWLSIGISAACLLLCWQYFQRQPVRNETMEPAQALA